DEQAAGEIQEIVACASRDGPFGWQALAWLKDFFGDDPCFGGGLAQAAEVLGRIAKTVWMIHADAIQFAAAEPIENQLVSVLENALVLGSDANQSVDIEKSAIDQFAFGGPPARKSIVLA